MCFHQGERLSAPTAQHCSPPHRSCWWLRIKGWARIWAEYVMASPQACPLPVKGSNSIKISLISQSVWQWLHNVHWQWEQCRPLRWPDDARDWIAHCFLLKEICWAWLFGKLPQILIWDQRHRGRQVMGWQRQGRFLFLKMKKWRVKYWRLPGLATGFYGTTCLSK